MGVVSKQIRKRANQKLASTLSTATSLSSADAANAVVGAIERFNTEQVEDVARRKEELSGQSRWKQAWAGTPVATKFHVDNRGGVIMVGWGRPPAWFDANPKPRLANNERHWLARVLVFRPKEAPESDGATVEVCLLRWIMDSDGKMYGKPLYEELTNRIWEAVQDRQAVDAANNA